MTSVHLELGATEPKANVCLRSQLLVDRITVALTVLTQTIRIKSPHISQIYFSAFRFCPDFVISSRYKYPQKNLSFLFLHEEKTGNEERERVILSDEVLTSCIYKFPQSRLSLVPNKDTIESS